MSDDGRGITADPATGNGANGGHGLVGGYVVTARLPIDAPTT